MGPAKPQKPIAALPVPPPKESSDVSKPFYKKLLEPLNIFGNLPFIPFMNANPGEGEQSRLSNLLPKAPHDNILTSTQYHSDIMSQLTLTTPEAVLDFNKMLSIQEELDSMKLVEFSAGGKGHSPSKPVAAGKPGVKEELKEEVKTVSDETKEDESENYFVYYQSVKRTENKQGIDRNSATETYTCLSRHGGFSICREQQPVKKLTRRDSMKKHLIFVCKKAGVIEVLM